MKIEIWSDLVCPWCYIGKRRFDAALARFAHRGGVEVVWRSFELDPSAPPVRAGAYAERLATKYRVSLAEAQAMIDRMVEAGALSGVVLRFEEARPGNTFDAHRLLHLARERGVQHVLEERLMAAVFTNGLLIGDVGTLVELAAATGVDPADAHHVLASDAYADDVRADEQRAAALGITSVPYFVIGGTFGVAGAQPPETLLRVLDDAWAETHTATVQPSS